MTQLGDIRLRDPFVFYEENEDVYYLFGTSDSNPWAGPGVGFDAYRSGDLSEWEGPLPVFRPRRGFWGTTQFWAPEVHRHQGRFYMLATFADGEGCRGTQALVADRVTGPYHPHSDGPLTPAGWKCLDGTLFLTPSGDPWLIFCHEWLQTGDGAICASPLSADLREATGDPLLLFRASQAPWVRPTPDAVDTSAHPAFVTDGPFPFRASDGRLHLLWSSVGDHGYSTGIATSASGSLTGPWTHGDSPLWGEDGGHAMIFHTRGGRSVLVFHHPNDLPRERVVMLPIVEAKGSLAIGSGSALLGANVSF